MDPDLGQVDQEGPVADQDRVGPDADQVGQAAPDRDLVGQVARDRDLVVRHPTVPKAHLSCSASC